MTKLVEQYAAYLPPPLRRLPWRAHPLDGKLLLFERASGLNALLEGAETAHLQRQAPRTLLIAVTNACNLRCDFCYRDRSSRSLWSYETLLAFCQEADRWGVLEVAFGGGEPMLFPRWQDFIVELHATTGLGVNFTTNGMLLTEEFLRAIAGRYGQIRVSLYEDNRWPETLALLARCDARFGVNWLVTPAELGRLEQKLDQLLALGVRDVLFLGYKGNASPELHLSQQELQRFGAFVNEAHARLGSAVQLKLDICWGDQLAAVPRLFAAQDCGAGDEFLSLTSDRCLKPCSFHQAATPFESLDDVRRLWRERRRQRLAAPLNGCARLPGRGLGQGGFVHDASIPLATV